MGFLNKAKKRSITVKPLSDEETALEYLNTDDVSKRIIKLLYEYFNIPDRIKKRTRDKQTSLSRNELDSFFHDAKLKIPYEIFLSKIKEFNWIPGIEVKIEKSMGITNMIIKEEFNNIFKKLE